LRLLASPSNYLGETVDDWRPGLHEMAVRLQLSVGRKSSC
jgi:hypothetical protein